MSLGSGMLMGIGNKCFYWPSVSELCNIYKMCVTIVLSCDLNLDWSKVILLKMVLKLMSVTMPIKILGPKPNCLMTALRLRTRKCGVCIVNLNPTLVHVLIRMCCVMISDRLPINHCSYFLFVSQPSPLVLNCPTYQN